MNATLNGVIDMHVHGAPSLAPRIDTWDFLREMELAGYRAVCLKEHFIPTVGMEYLFNRRPEAAGMQLLGALVLNNSVGGLNCMAIEACIRMGARQVFMPTVSAGNHLRYLQTVKSFGGGKLSVPEEPIFVTAPSGEITEPAKAVVRIMAEHPDIAFSMGHLSAAEIDRFLPYAIQHGIRKAVVDHPYFILGATVEQVESWAQQGAYINFTCSSLEGLGQNGHVPVAILRKTLQAVPEDRMVISTDFGQPYNGSPVIGMEKMMAILSSLGVSASRIRKMTSELPAYLMGV